MKQLKTLHSPSLRKQKQQWSKAERTPLILTAGAAKNGKRKHCAEKLPFYNFNIQRLLVTRGKKCQEQILPILLMHIAPWTWASEFLIAYSNETSGLLDIHSLISRWANHLVYPLSKQYLSPVSSSKASGTEPFWWQDNGLMNPGLTQFLSEVHEGLTVELK